MPVRLSPLGGPTLLVAEGGATSHTPDHSREGFELAVRLGATALAANAWRTADGVVVVRRSGVAGLRRRRIETVPVDQLGDHLGLDELLDVAGPRPVSLAVPDGETFDLICGVVRERPVGSEVWCRHDDVAELARWRTRGPDVRLVNTVRIPRLPGGPERRAADLRDAGIEAVEAPVSEWSTGHVALFHRFGRLAWATGAVHEPAIGEMLVMGLDAVAGPHVERLVDVAASAP
jgi:glycerophosphoryl diester phosphodiesterase